MFEKLKNTYNTFVNRFLSEDQKQQNNIQMETGRFALPSDESTNETHDSSRKIQEKAIVNRDGKVVLQLTESLEEEKADYNDLDNTDEAQGYNNMVVMKHGDEDLVEDEASVILNTGSKKKIAEQREDVVINESTAEQKVTGNIPMLKNNKNALIRNTKPFSQRLRNGELHIDINNINAVANQMIFEVNLLAGKTLVLQHKLVEVMRLSPRFIADYLCLEYREKIRNQLNDSIFRNVIETADFALPSEENIGEAHRLFANTKRATKYNNSNYGIRVYDLNYSQ